MAVDSDTIIFYFKTELLQNCPNADSFRQNYSLNCFIFVAIQKLSHSKAESNQFEHKPFLIELTKTHSTVSIESTILIFEIFRKGMAVANRQAKMEMIAASEIAKTGIAISCNVSVCAALTKTQQI